MTPLELTPSARRALRAKAHHLDPVVMIGHDGLTPAVLREIEVNLVAHELIKIRVFDDDRAAREALLAKILAELGAASVQHIGKLLVIFRPRPDDTPAHSRAKPAPKPKATPAGRHRASAKTRAAPASSRARPAPKPKATPSGRHRASAKTRAAPASSRDVRAQGRAAPQPRGISGRRRPRET